MGQRPLCLSCLPIFINNITRDRLDSWLAMFNELFGSDFLTTFLKFAIVGFSGMIVNFGITYLLKEKARQNKYFSNIMGFVVAATTNYFLHHYWTFQSQNTQMGKEYIQFFVVSTIGAAIDTATVYLLHNKLNLNFYLSKVFATGVAMVWNFLANLLFTFA